MKIARTDVHARKTCIPDIRFDDQELTSFAGLVVFQQFFKRIRLVQKLRRSFLSHQGGGSYGLPKIILCLLVHTILGFRKIRDIEYYRNDPMVEATLGLKSLPDVSTISRSLSCVDNADVEQFQNLVCTETLSCLAREDLRLVTLDFDGSVIRTGRYAEGAAVGFNPAKKGARSYYPLFCMVAQTGQVLDLLHRSGNVHDSNGSIGFVCSCVGKVRQYLPNARIEVRMDSAFFSDSMALVLEELGVEYAIAVPFERFCKLKDMIETRRLWYWTRSGNKMIEYFQSKWKPDSWNRKRRFIFVKTEQPVQRKQPVQLDLFEPVSREHQYKVVLSNKTTAARHVVRFHEGRGQQENVFGELKSQGSLDYVPFRRWNANKIYLLVNVLAHNLNRLLQISTSPKARNTTEKRAPLWIFEKAAVMRRNFIQRAARLTRPGGRLTMSVTNNPLVRSCFQRYMAA